jgi:hypothetical protein
VPSSVSGGQIGIGPRSLFILGFDCGSRSRWRSSTGAGPAIAGHISDSLFPEASIRYYDFEETDRAAAACFRSGEREGHALMTPNCYDSGMEGDTVFLRTGDRVLARYRVKPDGRLRRLQPRRFAPVLDKIVSGGQPGADQRALRASRAAGVATRGWAPAERPGPPPEAGDLVSRRGRPDREARRHAAGGPPRSRPKPVPAAVNTRGSFTADELDMIRRLHALTYGAETANDSPACAGRHFPGLSTLNARVSRRGSSGSWGRRLASSATGRTVDARPCPAPCGTSCSAGSQPPGATSRQGGRR